MSYRDKFVSEVKETPIGDWAEILQDYPVLPDIVDDLFPHLSIEDRKNITVLVSTICPGCYSRAKGCQCQNDE